MATKKVRKQRQRSRRLEIKRSKKEAKQKKRQQWKPAKAKRAKEKPKAAPCGASYLMMRFWEFFKFDEVPERLGQEKYKGLPLSTLFLVLMMFGVLNATSDSNLFDRAKADPLFVELCGLELLEKQQLYRIRKRLTEDEYDEWPEHMLRELQKDTRTASRRDGIVIGDDTVLLKYGRKMPDITVVYKSSEGHYGLGYAMPSTHYADADKDYPLFARLHYRNAEQKQEADDKRLRRRKKLDCRSPDDEIAWLNEIVEQGRVPEMVILRGTRLSLKMTEHCEHLGLNWLGISALNRKYSFEQKKDQKTKALLKQNPNHMNWKNLNDEGVRIAWMGPAESKAMGVVTLILAEQMENRERTLCVAPEGIDEELGAALVKTMLTIEKPAPENSKLHDMLGLMKKSFDFIQAETAVFDRWFYVSWFILKLIKEIGFKRVVIKAKADRIYSVKEQSGTWKQWEEEIRKYDRYIVRGQSVNLAQLKVTDSELGPVQLVFVQEIHIHCRKGEKIEKIGQCYALMCTDPKWKPDKVFQAYKLRWKIEEFYREVRQNHGLDKFHGRNKAAIHSHIVFAFLSYICVTLCRLWNAPLKDKTLGWIKRYLFRAIVKLKHQGKQIIVCFDPEWIDLYGLPDFCGDPLITGQQRGCI